MDEFYEYWELIPDSKKFEAIGQEIVKYKRNLQEPDVSSRDLPTEVIEFFQHHLLTQPYPTWDILYHIIDIRDHEKNRLLEEVLLNAITTLLDAITDNPEKLDQRDKLYNLISNMYISEWCSSRMRQFIFPRMFELKELGILDDVLLLALLSRSVLSLLTHYLDYERQQIIGRCQTKSLFLRTCYEKVHWVETIMRPSNDEAISSLNHTVYQHLKLLRKIIERKKVGSDDGSWFIELESIDFSVIASQSTLELCYIELMRQSHIFKFLRRHVHVGEFDLLSSSLIMNQLLSLQVEFSINTYDDIKKLLQTNHDMNRRQLETFAVASHQNRTEVDVLNEYIIMKLYLSIIQSTDAGQEISDSQQHIRLLLKTINDGSTLFQLMQNVFVMIFLRFEHIRKTKRKRKNSEAQSGSVSNQNNSHTTDVSDAIAETLQTGFVCLRNNLKAVLNSMRLFLMCFDQTEVFRTCDRELKDKFRTMLKHVDNALWRLRIIDSDGQKKPKSTQSVKAWISIHDQKSSKIQIEATSEDEKSLPKKKVRKKLKKRPKTSISEEANDEMSDDPIEYQLVTETSLTENSENRTHSRSTETQRKVRSIISKLLMSPESLVAICILKDDQENIQKITQEYNLQGSDMDKEVSFINNYRETKDKLEMVVERFEEISQREAPSMATSIEIEEIKNIAEGGFEKAKFVNMLEKFSQQNKITARNEDVKLLEHASVKHPQLQMYMGDNLNVLPLIDFMISLPCSFELNHNIYKYIVNQWHLTEGDDEAFGYRKFLKHLMDILTIFKNHNVNQRISDLLNDEIFTLEPTMLKKQLINRENVKDLLSSDSSQLQQSDSEFTDTLHKFELFEAEVNFFARIVSFMKSVRQLVKFQTNEAFNVDDLMALNLDEVIGKVIFQQQYSPEQVENFAFNSNINLVHTMAIAASRSFLKPGGDDDEKLLSLFHMSEIGAASVHPSLSTQDYKNINNVVSNMDILYYIKQESFMVAYLVKEIQNVEYKTLKFDDHNFIERMANLKSMETLMEIHENNMVSILSYDHVSLELLLARIKDTKDINQKLKLLSSITERQWNRNRVQFGELRDAYIEMLITTDLDGSQQKFVELEEIGSIRKFSELLLKCIADVKSDDDAERMLRWCLNPRNSVELDEAVLKDLQNWMSKLKIYRKIVKMFTSDESTASGTEVTWAKIKKLADEKPAILVNYLLNINTNLVLCLEFLKIHPLQSRTDEITKMWVEALNNRSLNTHHHLLFKIVETFPTKNVIDFFDFALGFINNLPSMVRVLNFLNKNQQNAPIKNRIRYQKFVISTKILECLEGDDDVWRLASRPLIILEQFLMNSKIEILRQILKNVRPILSDMGKCATCENTNSNMCQVGENLVYDFDAHHDDLFVTNECIDLLLKLYAAKALDFQIIEVHSVPSSTEVSSMDSTYGIFQMPKDIPAKEQWAPDNATNQCMCCKRQKFSLLTRRHHCRRCGRVVCSSCSQNRVEVGGFYNDMMVRVCNDCFHQMGSMKKRPDEEHSEKLRSSDGPNDWKLTGEISCDQMVRDEFNFECSPNVGLNQSIVNLHSPNEELAKFLLFHCHRLKLLLCPIRGKINPEVDLILVARMLKCLAFSAKIRGADAEANAIIDHADVVLKVARNGCEAIAPLIPMEPINGVTIRTLINDLIKLEQWKIALELSVKWDRSGTAGVFSAWGVSAIKSGQYRFAREKIALAIQAVPGSSIQTNTGFTNMLNDMAPINDKLYNFKRSSRSPPLLLEVLEALESTANKRKLAGTYLSPHKTMQLGPQKESSRNVLNVMDNLKRIVEGDYGPSARKPSDKFEWQPKLTVNNSYYEESLFYLMNYGGNYEFLMFFMKNNFVQPALRYALAQQVPYEIFIQQVVIPIVKSGKLEDLIELMKKMDSSLVTWKDHIMAICKHLERHRGFNCLYQLQILTGDYVRAAMTCIKFYLDGSGNYSELNSKMHHLVDAKNHLQAELEKAEQKKVEAPEIGRKDGIALTWDLKAINAYINLISLQLEISKYLAKCESEGLPTIGIMKKIFMDKPGMKSLFGTTKEQGQVAILLLICGQSIESGYGISYRVIQECSLTAEKIYSTCTKYLAKNLSRLLDVEKLVKSIKANASNEGNHIDEETAETCDELVAMAVEIAYNQHQNEAKSQIDQLIRMISSKKMKVQCYINSNQLKTAYVLSASLNLFDDIKQIMKKAHETRQENVRRLCEKKLRENGDRGSQSSKSDI